jgi:hypothetical protein
MPVLWSPLRTIGIGEPALVNTRGICLPNQALYSISQGRCSIKGLLKGGGGLCLPKYYKYEPSPRYCQPPRPSPSISLTFPLGSGLTYSNLSAIPYLFRNCTRITNTEPTLSSTASSTTLEYTEPVTDRPILGRRLEIRRPKRSFSGSSGEVARKVHLLQIGNTELISTGLVKYDL